MNPESTPPHAPENLCGCVLAGGSSIRMGRDKALLGPFGGPTLLERAWRTLSALCGKVFVAATPGRSYPPYPCIYDATPGHGPIAGVIRALHAARGLEFRAVAALACDIPLMRPELLLRLAQGMPKDALGAFYLNPQSGKIEMLAGIYRAAALAPLEAAEKAERFSLYHALSREHLHIVPLEAADAAALLNCNYGCDLEKLRPERL